MMFSGTMHAITFNSHGDIGKLTYDDIPVPKAEAGEALIKVHAAALNGFDPMILKGIPGLTTPFPMIPCGDVAGEVVHIADGSEFSVGERILIDPAIPNRANKKGGILGETVRGGACQYIAAPISNLVKLPANVSFESAACLPIAYGTAHRMMITRAEVSSGDRVLILGATGGVGVCCLQLAKMAGAEVAVCTSSMEKGAALKSLGADHIINTDTQDLVEECNAIWGKPRVFGESGGADIVVNYNGGDSWAQSMRIVKRGGKLVTCGATNGYSPPTDIRFIWSFEINILGSNMWTREDLVTLLDLVSQRKIKPVIYSVRDLTELPIALQELIDRKVVGKSVIKVC